MGYGTDYETIEYEDDSEKPLSNFEKMLKWHELTKEEFYSFSKNEQSEFQWNYEVIGGIYE